MIFCTTRKQCSPVYKAFAVALDEKLYLDGNKDPRKRIVDMYHAGTPEKVKEHILSQLISMQGHLRVLICTIAFGMGVDCKYISQVIHFGGSRNIESYLQECVRAGRNSELSTCYLLYNGILMKRCDEDMKNYVFFKIMPKERD